MEKEGKDCPRAAAPGSVKICSETDMALLDQVGPFDLWMTG
jgi:hypothetical protein